MDTYLKKLILSNFQKHSNLEIDFTPGVNVITGLTATGKSCCRRALGWVVFNTSISDVDLRKEGTKKTSVIVVYNTGVEVERIKSASINRYVLRVPGKDEQIFDSFGKTIPEEIENIFQTGLIVIGDDSLNINIAEQLTLPFLLDKPASFRAKLFNKLTGNEILDKLFKECNKESLRINRELKTVDETIEKQKDDIISYSEKYKLYRKKLENVKKLLEDIKDKQKTYEILNKLANDLTVNETAKNETKEKSKKIKILTDKKISSLKEKAEYLEKIVDLSNDLSDVKNKLYELKSKTNKKPNINFKSLKEKVEKLKVYNKLYENSREIVRDCTTTDSEMKRLNETIASKNEALKHVWEECDDTCPLCKQKRKE